MTRIIWTEPAIAQLQLIHKLELRQNVYRAVAGLAQYPRRGRVPPEVRDWPELDEPLELREVIFPGMLRVFYRYDSGKDFVRILAIAFRGQDISRDWLGEHMN